MDSRTKIPPLTKILEQSEIEKIPSDILQKIEAFCETCEEKLTAASAFANTSIEELGKDIELKLDEGKTNIAQFNDQLKVANSEIDRLNEQVVQQELETISYRKERDDVIDERDHLLKSSDCKQRAIIRLQCDIDSLNIQFKSAVSEKGDAIARLAKIAEKGRCVDHRLKLMVEETDLLNTEIVSLKRQIESGLKKSSDEQVQTEKLQSRLRRARVEIQSKNQQINNLSKLLQEKRVSELTAEFEVQKKRVAEFLVTNDDYTKKNVNVDTLQKRIRDKNSEDFPILPIERNNLATMVTTGKENLHEVIEELRSLKTEMVCIEQDLAAKIIQLQIYVDERKSTQDELNYLRQMNRRVMQQIFDHINGSMQVTNNEQNRLQNENIHNQKECNGEIDQLQENEDKRDDNSQIFTLTENIGPMQGNCQSSKTLTIPNCNIVVVLESSTETDPPPQLHTGCSSMTQENSSSPTTSHAGYISPTSSMTVPLTESIQDADDFSLNRDKSLSSLKPSTHALKLQSDQRVHHSSPGSTMPSKEKSNHKRLSEQSEKMLQENKKTRVSEQSFKSVSESGLDIEYLVPIYSQIDEEDEVAINCKEVFEDEETIEADQNVEIDHENEIFDKYEDDIYGDNVQYDKNVVVIDDSIDTSNQSWNDVAASSFAEPILGDIGSPEQVQRISVGNDLSISGEESTGSQIQPSTLRNLDIQQQTYEGTNNDVIDPSTPTLDVGPGVSSEVNSYAQPIVEASGTSLANWTFVAKLDNTSEEIDNSCTDINFDESDNGDQSVANHINDSDCEGHSNSSDLNKSSDHQQLEVVVHNLDEDTDNKETNRRDLFFAKGPFTRINDGILDRSTFEDKKFVSQITEKVFIDVDTLDIGTDEVSSDEETASKQHKMKVDKSSKTNTSNYYMRCTRSLTNRIRRAPLENPRLDPYVRLTPMEKNPRFNPYVSLTQIETIGQTLHSRRSVVRHNSCCSLRNHRLHLQLK